MSDNARGPRFTITLKRSTQNLQLSTSRPADYPIFGSSTEVRNGVLDVGFTPKNGHYVAGRACPFRANSGSSLLRQCYSPDHQSAAIGRPGCIDRFLLAKEAWIDGATDRFLTEFEWYASALAAKRDSERTPF